MNYDEIIKKLKSLANPRNVEGMARFGIRPKTKVLGVPIPELRKIAKQIRQNVGCRTSHILALKLWDSKIHEARLLAGFIDNPAEVSEKQIDKWVADFDSWDVCDQVCSNLFDKTPFAYKKVFELSKINLPAGGEFVKRTAFTLIACLSVHDKKAQDKDFIKFFPLIKKASTDERNFVKKAVNWALRQIGKRNKKLNKEAINLAKEIQKINSKSAKWIASDAIRELISEKIQEKFKDE